MSRQIFRSRFQSQIASQYQIGVKDKKWYWTKQWPDGDDPSEERPMVTFNYPYTKIELRPPTEAEAWTRYQNGGRFIFRNGINKRLIACPECKGSGRVKEASKGGLNRSSGGRRSSGDNGMRSVACKQCNGKARISVPTAFEYRVLCRAEKETDQEKARENLETFLGAPLGQEINPHKVSWIFKKQPGNTVLLDYLPKQDFLKFSRYFVALVPGTQTVHSVVAFAQLPIASHSERFNAVLQSIRAAYGNYFTEKGEDGGKLVRFTCKANPNRQILVSWRLVQSTEKSFILLFVQATDCELQKKASASMGRDRLKADDLKDAVDAL